MHQCFYCGSKLNVVHCQCLPVIVLTKKGYRGEAFSHTTAGVGGIKKSSPGKSDELLNMLLKIFRSCGSDLSVPTFNVGVELAPFLTVFEETNVYSTSHRMK